jgi:hypothetical protein
MEKKAVAVKTSTIRWPRGAAHPDLARYGRDLEEWPRSWMGEERDLPPGENLVARFRPFLEYLVGTNLSRKTIRRHIDNLWVLGGEIIRDLNETPSLRQVPMERLLNDVIDEEGGPLIHNCDSEEEQRSFDTTCRKLHRYLTVIQQAK